MVKYDTSLTPCKGGKDGRDTGFAIFENEIRKKKLLRYFRIEIEIAFTYRKRTSKKKVASKISQPKSK